MHGLIDLRILQLLRSVKIMRLPLTCALNADSSEMKVKTLDKINRNNERQRLRDNLSNLRTFEVSA